MRWVRSALARLGGVWLAAATAVAPAAGSTPPPPAAVVEVRQALFEPLPPTLDTETDTGIDTDAAPGSPPPTARPVDLPDTWAARGLDSAPRFGRYRWSLTLPAGAGEAQSRGGGWALQATRLSPRLRLWINGRLAVDTLHSADLLRRPLPQLIPLAPDLLRAGPNAFVLDIDPGQRAGLSRVRIGPLDRLDALQTRTLLTDRTLPLLLNIAAGTLALAMLLLWARRRGERALGCFAALTLLCALRNCAYFVHGSLLGTELTDWLFFCAQAWSVALLGQFILLWTARDRPLLRRLLWAMALAWPLLAALAVLGGRTAQARVWLYPGLLLLTVWPLHHLAQAAFPRPGSPPGASTRQARALLFGLALALAGGVHDYLYQTGLRPITDRYLLPWLVPLLLLLFSAQWLQRLVLALSEAEHGRDLLEQRVAERTRALQVAHAGTSRFLAAASHDLRQPMVGIGLLVGLLQEQVPPGPLQRLSQRLGDAVQAMEGLLKRLLDLSRLEAGVVRARWQAVDLDALLRTTLDQHAPLAEQKGLRLALHPPPRGLRLRSDPALLEQVLHNLVANAVRHTASGGVLIALRRGGRAAHWQLSVIDTGPGIAPERQDQIFEDWVQLVGAPGGHPQALSAAAPTARPDGTLEGLGLGLAIARRAAQALGTPVQLRSRPGRGSRFWIEVEPWAEEVTGTPVGVGVGVGGPAAAPGAPDSGPPDTATGPAPLAGQEVWLLEDDPDAGEALRLRLERWQARVRPFTHAAQAHAALAGATRPPALWICDQRLPDGRGSQVLAAARARWPRLPALLISGDTGAGDLDLLETQRALGIPVLHKPFQAAALRAVLLEQLAPQPGSAGTTAPLVAPLADPLVDSLVDCLAIPPATHPADARARTTPTATDGC